MVWNTVPEDTVQVTVGTLRKERQPDHQRKRGGLLVVGSWRTRRAMQCGVVSCDKSKIGNGGPTGTWQKTIEMEIDTLKFDRPLDL